MATAEHVTPGRGLPAQSRGPAGRFWPPGAGCWPPGGDELGDEWARSDCVAELWHRSESDAAGTVTTMATEWFSQGNRRRHACLGSGPRVEALVMRHRLGARRRRRRPTLKWRRLEARRLQPARTCRIRGTAVPATGNRPSRHGRGEGVLRALRPARGGEWRKHGRILYGVDAIIRTRRV